jgi:hypothetical protein
MGQYNIGSQPLQYRLLAKKNIIILQYRCTTSSMSSALLCSRLPTRSLSLSLSVCLSVCLSSTHTFSLSRTLSLDLSFVRGAHSHVPVNALAREPSLDYYIYHSIYSHLCMCVFVCVSVCVSVCVFAQVALVEGEGIELMVIIMQVFFSFFLLGLFGSLCHCHHVASLSHTRTFAHTH